MRMMQNPGMTDAGKQRSLLRRRIQRNWQAYVLLAIPLIYLLVFKYYPMFGVQIAFKNFQAAKGIWGSPWVGFAQFEKFFTSSQFKRILPNTVILSLYALAAGFPIPILLALSLNTLRSNRFKKIVQTITYIPHFISVVVIVGMMMAIFSPRTGLVGTVYHMITGRVMADLFGKPAAFRHLYVWSGVWQSMGWSSIIYMAALSGVDQQLHEAAQIDGASRLQRVFHIDVPSILPTAVILLILNSGNIMSIGFEKIYIMQNTMNLRASEVISTYVYKVSMAAGGGDFSYGTAIGLFNSVINLAMLCLVNFISKKVTSSSLW
ncbi:MAG: ABC transporter permease subunit [Eubacteriales bacterium]|nr:ABC transporter permease subunit [Eubacteriales bacterium]